MLSFFPQGRPSELGKDILIPLRAWAAMVFAAQGSKHTTHWKSQPGGVEGVPTLCSVRAYSWKTCELSDEKPFGRL